MPPQISLCERYTVGSRNNQPTIWLGQLSQFKNLINDYTRIILLSLLL